MLLYWTLNFKCTSFSAFNYTRTSVAKRVKSYLYANDIDSILSQLFTMNWRTKISPTVSPPVHLSFIPHLFLFSYKQSKFRWTFIRIYLLRHTDCWCCEHSRHRPGDRERKDSRVLPYHQSYLSRVSFSKVKPSKFDFCCIVSVIRLTTRESVATSFVNSVSKLRTSLCDVEAGGLNSGSYPLCMTLFMSKELKKGVLFISLAPEGPHPRRSETFRSSMPRSRSFAFSDSCSLSYKAVFIDYYTR